MSTLGQVLSFALWLYWLLFLARIIFDLVQIFARGWSPRGIVLVIAEFVYTLTDPPLRVVRKVIPPLRLGDVQFDLAFLIVLIALQILISITASL